MFDSIYDLTAGIFRMPPLSYHIKAIPISFFPEVLKGGIFYYIIRIIITLNSYLKYFLDRIMICIREYASVYSILRCK